MLKNTAFILAGLMLIGCGEDTDKDTGDIDDTGVEATEFELLTDYMAAEDLDLPTMLDDWIIGPQDVFDSGVENFFVVDIRKADKYEVGVVDFDEGHIPGAHSVAMADVVEYVQTNNTESLPVLVTCYTGHDSTHATMALRLHGIEAQSLKWGMSGWHSDFDLWTGFIGNAALDFPEAWSTDAPPDLPTFEGTPTIDTGATDGAEILAAQITDYVVTDLNGVVNEEVLSSPDDYHVITYWGVEDWDTYGHIAGAYQVDPGSLTLDTLDMLPIDKTIVIYCWSGQNSSMINAWLQALGYDAKTLKFGVNGMIYDSLEKSKWTGAADLSYDTE